MNATDRTPADLLRSALSTDPARPLVTFYDDATGERVELSVATFANWVAKTANLLQGELSAEPGERVALLLPAHWQTAVWLLACSSVGVVADLGATRPRRTTSSPDRAGSRTASPAPASGSRCPSPRSAAASRPRPRGTPTTRWRSRARATGSRRTRRWTPRKPALIVAGAAWTGAEVVEQARSDAPGLDLTGPGSRILSALPYDTWEGLSAGLYAPLATGGSVVLCRHLDQLGDDRLAQRIESERVTATAR